MGVDLEVGEIAAWAVIYSGGRHHESQDSNCWLTLNYVIKARIDNTSEVIHGEMVEGRQSRGARSGSG
jgi:hypothetical protein